MKNKIIIPACFAVAAVIGAGLIYSFMGVGNNLASETVEETVAEESTTEKTGAEDSTEEYVETDRYRDSRSDQNILPERVEISDADGNVTMQ